MTTDNDPIVGNWYQRLDKGQAFKIVAADEEEGVIEIQHFDGELEELDLDSWFELETELIDEPEDWTGPVDDVERDDLGYSETDMDSEDWRRPLQEAQRYAEDANEGEGEEGWDEWGVERMQEEPWEQED